jgi:hypothetical protein
MTQNESVSIATQRAIEGRSPRTYTQRQIS